MSKELTPLEALDKLYDYALGKGTYSYGVCYNIIETELKRLEKQDKILRIIKEKDVFVWGFRNRHNEVKNGELTYDFYLKHCGYYHSGFNWKKLTEQEFDLLKEYFK